MRTAVLLGCALVLQTMPAHADVRVERRVLEKRGHVFPRLGFAYLVDRSYYTNPALDLGASIFVTETIAIDIESAFLFSSLNSAGKAVRDLTGLVPDAAEPELLLSIGARYAFGYGKMQVDGVEGIARFVPTVAGHFVIKKTDADWNAGFRLEIAFLFQLHRYLTASIGWAFVGTFENRSSGNFMASQLPYISLGSML